MTTIAIVGGGFSGTMAAVNLARLAESPLRVTLINRGFPLGRGVAYSTGRDEHLLNVAARNMSALADDANHFLEWLRTRSEYARCDDATLRETFVPRRVYGDYVSGLLWQCLRPLGRRPAASIELVDDEAVDVALEDSGARVSLAGGESIVAEKVLLATGNQPPAQLPGSEAVLEHPAYCPVPWGDWTDKLPDPKQTVVLLGTGLTTIDAVLTLQALGWRGPIVAVSRHGLLPRSHFRGIEYLDFPPHDPASLGLAGLVRLLEEHCQRLERLGANTAIVVDRLRGHTQRIWQAFSLAEKREFCSRYYARWNVLRHRIAPSIHERVTEALTDGRLRVVKGSIRGLEAAGPCLRVIVQDGGQPPQTIDAGLVVNCTGPQASFTAAAEPLFANLLSRGLVQSDPMDMGLAVDVDFAAIDGQGQRSARLFAIGPLLRGTLWETVAVPELRGQALRVAQTMLEECAAEGLRGREWPVAAEVDVLEYCI